MVAHAVWRGARVSCFLQYSWTWLLHAAESNPQVLEAQALSPDWLSKGRIQVIAHRGASAWHPEHTLAAYERAIQDGADFIEPDLVMSGDGVLIARHENEISASTNVAEHKEYASRRTRRMIDGQLIDGWFCEDFSLVELRTLRAREPLPALRGCAQDDLHGLATFDEIIELASQASVRLGRDIGIIPELKHSSYFRSTGLNLEVALLEAWNRHRHLQTAPFGIQSFEVGNLRQLREAFDVRSGNVFLVQLIGELEGRPFDLEQSGDPTTRYADMMAPAGLAAIARYARVVAPHKRMIVPIHPASGVLMTPTTLVRDAHAAGLAVHAWTLRPENHFLPAPLRGSDDPAQRCEAGSIREMLGLMEAGVDAIFTDDPALGRQAVARFSHVPRDST